MLKSLLTIIIISYFCAYTYSQSISDTSKVLLRFNEQMSREGIFEIANYKIVKDGLTEMNIYKVGVVHGDSAVVLFVNKFTSNSQYIVVVSNLKDKSGNPIHRDFNSFSFTSNR